MPRVDPYQETTQARGLNRTSVSPDEAGAGVGEAVASLGDTLVRYEARKRAAERDQAALWANTASAEAELQLRQKFKEHVDALDPTAPGYGEQVSSLTDTADQMSQTAEEKLLDSAPDDFTRKLMQRNFATARVRTMASAMDTESSLQADYTKTVVKNGIEANSNVLAADPSNETYSSLVDNAKTSIGQLTTVDPSVKTALFQDAKKRYGMVQVMSQASQHPMAFLKSISPNGGYTGSASTTVQNFNANLVKPYTPDQIQNIAAKASAPSKYDPLFAAAAAKYGVSEQELKLRAVVESGLDPSASSGQADGLMQISPAMAKQYGIDPKDPAQAVDLAAKLVAQAKAHGENADLVYYGGADPSSWGPNTQQYAANVSAVRAALGGSPQVRPLGIQDIAGANPGIAGWNDLDLGDRIKAVRSAEATLGKTMAGDRGFMQQELKDARASLLAGKDYPGLDQPRFSEGNLVRLYGPVKGAALSRDLGYWQQVGGFVKQMATMPNDQLAASLQHLQPQGGQDEAERQRVFAAASAAAQKLVKERTTTPVEYAIQHGIQDAQPLDFSNQKNLEAGLRNRAAVMDTMTHDFGSPEAVFTKPETDQITQALKGMPGAEAVKMLGTMHAALGDSGAYSVALSQLAPHDRVIAYAGELASKDGSAYVGDTAVPTTQVAATVLDGERILDGRAFAKSKQGDQPGSVPSGSKAFRFDDTNFRMAFNQELGNAFQSPDAQMSASQQTEMYQAARAYYVAQAYKTGGDLSVIDPDKVTQAIQAVVGSTWQTAGGTLIAPYGMKLDTFQGQWTPRATQTLQQDGFSEDDARRILDGNAVGGQSTKPINLGDGRYGFQVGTSLLYGPNGKPVVIDYSQPFTGTLQPPYPNDALGAGAKAGLPMMGMK